MSMSASLILGICLIIHHPRKIPNWMICFGKAVNFWFWFR
ncbi:hypothetical protein LINPERPRIM_LOCUS4020 [Linum perenne]